MKVRQAGDVAVLDVSGRVTLGEASIALLENLRQHAATGQARLLLNLSGVTFMDSAGLGALVSGYVSVSHNHGRMKICGLSNRLRDLLQVTRLYGVLQVYELEEDALRSFDQ